MMCIKRGIWGGLLLILWASPSAESISMLTRQNFEQWKEKIFSGNTRYTWVSSQEGDVLKAESHQSASALYYAKEIDLHKTPFLNWRWRIENVLDDLDEKTKAGDDYPARIYVVLPSSWPSLKPRSVNYVWSSRLEKNTVWTSAYTDKVKLVAVEGGRDLLGRWLVEKRNVREDIQRLFGEDIRYIKGLALMSDTDNSGHFALAYYGDIYFADK